jgi:hypothetical protein
VVVRRSLAVAAVLAACGGKVTNGPEASPSTTEAVASGNYEAGGAGVSIGGAGGLTSATGGVVTGGAGGTLTEGNGETPGGTAGATGGLFGGGGATFAGGTVETDSGTGGSVPTGGVSGVTGHGDAGVAGQGGNGGTSPGGAGGAVLAGGAGGQAGASEISGSSGADGDAGTEVVCTESTTLCAGGDGITDGTCYDRECKGYLYSESYSTFQSGPPCPADFMQALGSDCEPEGTNCGAGSDEYGCFQADPSHCYIDSCEVSPDGLNICQPVCMAYSSWYVSSLYVCVSGGLCQECVGEWCGTLISCSGGLWTLVSDGCTA